MAMGKHEAEERFNASDTLYREGKYEDALKHLDALNKAFPNTRNVLFPRARCLAKMGRYDEAAACCDELAKRFQDKRAIRLREQINAKRFSASAAEFDMDGPSLENLSADLGDMFAPVVPPPVQHAPVAAEGRDWKKIGLVAGGVAVAALLLLLPILLSDGSSRSADPASQTASAEDEAMPAFAFSEDGDIVLYGYALTTVGYIIVGICITTFHYTISLFITLLLVNKLPDETPGNQILNVLVVSLICATLGTVFSAIMRFGACGALVANLGILRNTYDMGIVDFIVLFVIGGVVGALLIIVFLAVGVALGFAAMGSEGLEGATAMTYVLAARLAY